MDHKKDEINENEVKMAVELIGNLAEPEKHEDEQRKILERHCCKIAGKEIAVARQLHLKGG